MNRNHISNKTFIMVIKKIIVEKDSGIFYISYKT